MEGEEILKKMESRDDLSDEGTQAKDACMHGISEGDYEMGREDEETRRECVFFGRLWISVSKHKLSIC